MPDLRRKVSLIRPTGNRLRDAALEVSWGIVSGISVALSQVFVKADDNGTSKQTVHPTNSEPLP